MTPDLRCAECRFTGHQFMWLANGKKCPKCQSPIPPYDPDNDILVIGKTDRDEGGVWIRVGWAEFRIMAIWARFWAQSKRDKDPEQHGWMLRVIDAITANLRKAGGGAPLTMADDMEIARRTNPNAKLVDHEGKEIVLEPGWLNRPAAEETKEKTDGNVQSS